jgi:hypothetical protein
MGISKKLTLCIDIWSFGGQRHMHLDGDIGVFVGRAAAEHVRFSLRFERYSGNVEDFAFCRQREEGHNFALAIFEPSQATLPFTPTSHDGFVKSFEFIAVLKRSNLHLDRGVFGGIEQRHQVMGMNF